MIRVAEMLQREEHMTQDEIIEMARLVGMGFYRGLLNTAFNNGVAIEELEAFAKLVEDAAIAKEREGLVRIIEANILDEREACAKVCESLFDLEDDTCNEAEQCAAAIRARSCLTETI